MEITPSRGWISDKRVRIIMEDKTIGMSVTSGAMATLTPSLIPCLMVSEITSVKRGPGVIPLLSPNIMPEMRNVNNVVMGSTLRLRSCGGLPKN